MNELSVTSTVKENPSVPATTRPPCPFYGFVGIAKMLVDNHGNGCGIAGGHRPCAMEMDGKNPSWKCCPHFNNKPGTSAMLDLIFDHCRVFPDELIPEGTQEWEGITLREWFQRVLPK